MQVPKTPVRLAIVALVLLAGHLSASQAADHEYVGSKKCKMCHLKEWKSWAETKMARSFEVLKAGGRAEAKTRAGLDPARDYTADPACVPCHVTGHGKPGGFVDIASTPDLAGVGCEVCHGPGGTYLQPEHMSLKNKSYQKTALVAVGLVDTVGEAQCTTCHNAESPFVADGFVFDFETHKSEGTHAKYPLKYEH